MMRGVLSISAAVVAAALAGGGCGGGGQLSGAGGAGVISTGRAGAPVMTGSGGSGPTGAGGGPTNCGWDPVPAATRPPDIFVVLDTSVSMNDAFDGTCVAGCGSSSKWAITVAAVEASLSASPGAPSWGLELMNHAGDACDAGGVTVPVGFGGAVIPSALAGRSSPAGLASPGNTPARAAIEIATAYLSALTPGPLPIIVLITDGVPDCGPGAPDPLASDADGAIQATVQAKSAGFGTCVIGLGTSGTPAEDTLAQMASGCPVSLGYVPVTRGEDIVDAFNTISGDGSACRFVVPDPPTNADGITATRGDFSVSIAGTGDVPYDPVNGWTFTEGSMNTIEFHGESCTASNGQYVLVHYLCLI